MCAFVCVREPLPLCQHRRLMKGKGGGGWRVKIKPKSISLGFLGVYLPFHFPSPRSSIRRFENVILAVSLEAGELHYGPDGKCTACTFNGRHDGRE